MYSKKVQEYFIHPRNFGEIKNADAIGEAGNMRCGDIMKLWLKIDPKTRRIKDIKFKTFGCAAAIASSSILTEMVKGKTAEQAQKITNQDVLKKLGGLPPLKLHCSVLAVSALKDALKNWESTFYTKP